MCIRDSTSRWLADFGARVIKVGPPPKQSGVQIVPPFYAYGGHRGMERVQLDLKADACLLYTSPSPRDRTRSRMPSSA